MKRLAVTTFVLLLLSLSAEAQVRWGARVGIADGEPMVGGELVTPIGAGFVFNPNVEVSSELFSLNADVHYDFEINRGTDFWVGAGLAFVSPDQGDDDGGVNLLAGIGTRRNNLYPYAQLKLTSAGDIDDYATIAVGVRF
jgi:hypothetical protein